MQVMQCIFLALAVVATLLQQSAALPLTSTRLAPTGAGPMSSTNPLAWKRGLFRGRRKKTEEEVQEEVRNKVLFSSPSGKELKSKDLEKLSEEDFHKYMKDHVDRLDHAEANKLAKHLEKKVAKHSLIRANALDAIHAQLKKEELKSQRDAEIKAKEIKQKAFKYDTPYELAHWEGNYAKTADLAKDKNPTIDHLHNVITESQQKIEKLHGVSQHLNEHVKDLWWNHQAARQAEGREVKKSVDKTLRDAHENVKKIDMYPNVKKTWEAQEAKKAQEAAKKAKEEEEKAAQRAASRSGSGSFSKIGSYLGFKSSPSRNSNSSGSNRSSSSTGGSSRNSRTSTDDSNRGERQSTSDDSDGSVRSGSTASPTSSPNSVLPGNSNTGPFGHRKSVG